MINEVLVTLLAFLFSMGDGEIRPVSATVSTPADQIPFAECNINYEDRTLYCHWEEEEE